MAYRMAPRRLLVALRNLAVGVTLVASAVLGLSVAGAGQAARAATAAPYWKLTDPGAWTSVFTSADTSSTGRDAPVETVLSGPVPATLSKVTTGYYNTLDLDLYDGSPATLADEYVLFHATVESVTYAETSAGLVVKVTITSEDIEQE
jgi:hypothetical protein